MDTNNQKSTKEAYIKSIGFLEQARKGLQSTQDVVRSHRESLATHYQGRDGVAFGQVIDTWLEEVDRIMNTCIAMENTLGESMQRDEHVQESNFQAVVNSGGGLTGFGEGVTHVAPSVSSTADSTYGALVP
ncbi:hypothetical protein ACWDE9_01705 [Streptomyces olivaceoviridis]|uniref:hypothetical protein n=1 Tax=Streptomyces olivaceoviridis TaxID=1921 RepID=UPI0016792E87|nr:hypothetical protein [Streptomyces olivaceoviridis]GGZ01067.1 hypothetical protein GCM10010300_51280 [Streptomyces olivaceoviridis]